MSHRFALITVFFTLIGVVMITPPASARLIHLGTISMDVPDTWKAWDCAASSDPAAPEPPVASTRRCSWEALEGSACRGFLTAGVLDRMSPVCPAGVTACRQELERRLRELALVKDVHVRQFAAGELDGAPVYRARYTLTAPGGQEFDQCLYIVGGSETSFVAFTSSSEPGIAAFDRLMEHARVHPRPHFLGMSREGSLKLLGVLAAASLLIHAARALLGRVARVPVEARQTRDSARR